MINHPEVKDEKPQIATAAPDDLARKSGNLETCGTSQSDGPPANDASANPLLQFSLAGQGNALLMEAEQQKPLLGNLTLKGQISAWYAQPNTGKTLLTLALVVKAVNEKRIDGDKVFYINADDSAGGLAKKVQLLDDLNIQTLTPSYNGFDFAKLAPAMVEMAANGTAKGAFIIIDTLKKFSDLMSKKEMLEFGKIARQFSLQGGSMLVLAHTNKNRASSGKLIHAGTTDLVEDFDSIHMMETVEGWSQDGHKLIRVEASKRRGDNAELAHFKFNAADGLSYEERLLSVTETDPDYGDIEELRDTVEDDVIEHIKVAISKGYDKKMQIVLLVGKAVRTSREKTLAILKKHCGSDPEKDLWDYTVRERGAHVYFVHPILEQAEG